MALANMSQQTAALGQAVSGLGTAARNTGAQMDDLSDSVLSYGKALFTLSSYDMLKNAFNWLMKFSNEQKVQLVNAKMRYKTEQEALDQAKQKLALLQAATVRDEAEIIKQKRIKRDAEAQVALTRDEVELRRKIGVVMEKHPIALKTSTVILSTTAALWYDTLRTTHSYNRALIQANTNLTQRYELVKKLANVQAATGLDTETMVESTRALVDYGQEMTPQFQSHVKLVGMMSEGLGVSASTAAQMVVVFSRQLKTGAESVANVIAQVAAQTGLAAEKAVAFASEIGKALRLLGGFRTESAGVVRVITALAGRVQELGGNAESVVNAFRRMSGGSSEAFFMRSLAGVRSPGELGSSAGAETAMQNLVTRMASIVTAPGGTNMYAAQLEAVAEMTGMTANELLDLQQVMKELNKPLGETQTLAKAYRDQSAAVGKSWDQMRESLRGLVTGALAPFAKFAAEAAASLADVIKTLSDNQGFVWFLRIAIPVAAGVAVVGLATLGWQIMRLALQSKAAALVMGQNFPQLTGWMTKLRAGAGVGAMGAGSAIGAGALGLGIGVGVGMLADKLMDKYTWSQYLHPLGYLKIISRTVGEMSVRQSATDSRSMAFYRSGTLKETIKATQMLAQYALGEKDVTKAAYEAQLTKALGTAVDEKARQSVMDYVQTKGPEAVQNELYLREMRRMSFVSPDEDKQDREAWMRLAAEQSELQAKIAESTKKSAFNLDAWLKQNAEGTSNEYWRSLAPVTNAVMTQPFIFKSTK